jgi:hypothetical protein
MSYIGNLQAATLRGDRKPWEYRIAKYMYANPRNALRCLQDNFKRTWMYTEGRGPRWKRIRPAWTQA